MLTSLRPKFGDLFSSRDLLPAKISALSAQNAFSKELEDKKSQNLRLSMGYYTKLIFNNTSGQNLFHRFDH